MIEQLSEAELDGIRWDTVEAIELTSSRPLCEAQDLAEQWILKAREDSHFDKYLSASPVVQASAGESLATLDKPATPVSGVDHTISEASSNTLLDGPKVQSVPAHRSVSNFAAVPCNTSSRPQLFPSGSTVAAEYDFRSEQGPIENDTLIIRAEVERFMNFKSPTRVRDWTTSEDQLAPPILQPELKDVI